MEQQMFEAARDSFGNRWVMSWEEFREAGGTIQFSAERKRCELRLPEPYKFAPHFMAECT